jgi:hypothetical protein
LKPVLRHLARQSLKLRHGDRLSFMEDRFSKFPDGEAVENMVSVVIEHPQVV